MENQHLNELFLVVSQDKQSWTREEVTNLMAQAYLHGQNFVLALWTTEIKKIKEQLGKPLDADARDILLARCMGTLEGILAGLKVNPEVERKIIKLLIDLSKVLPVEETVCP